MRRTIRPGEELTLSTWESGTGTYGLLERRIDGRSVDLHVVSEAMLGALRDLLSREDAGPVAWYQVG